MGGRVAAGCVSAGFLAAASVLALEAADPAAEALAGAFLAAAVAAAFSVRTRSLLKGLYLVRARLCQVGMGEKRTYLLLQHLSLWLFWEAF